MNRPDITPYRMERPNITPGEWTYRFDDTGNAGLVESPHHQGVVMNLVAECYEESADAKAISALPEMIDALMGAYEELYQLMKEAHWTKEAENEELMEEIINALQKAGVEF